MRDWSVQPLSSIADIRPSNVDKKTVSGESSVRLCNYMDVYGRRYITADLPFMEATASPSEIARFRVSRGDVIVTKDSETPDDIGVPSVVVDDVDDLVCGYHLALLKPRAEIVDSSYLAKQLEGREVARYFGRVASGSTRYGLGSGALGATPIPLAPRAVQPRIAEILSTVDDAIAETEALIAKTQQVKLGLMHDLFTRGVDGNGELRANPEARLRSNRFKTESTPPDGWTTATLGQISTRRREKGVDGLPVMSIVMGRGLVPRSEFDRRVESNLLPEEHALVRRDDIAYNMMRMWQGVLGRAEYDCLVSPAYVVMTPGPRVTSRFLYRLLSATESIAKFKRMSFGIVDDRLRLYAPDLVRIDVSFPVSLTEQTMIADRLDAIDREDEELHVELTNLRALRAGLMQDLLTGRVRVPPRAGDV